MFQTTLHYNISTMDSFCVLRLSYEHSRFDLFISPEAIVPTTLDQHLHDIKARENYSKKINGYMRPYSPRYSNELSSHRSNADPVNSTLPKPTRRPGYSVNITHRWTRKIIFKTYGSRSNNSGEKENDTTPPPAEEATRTTAAAAHGGRGDGTQARAQRRGNPARRRRTPCPHGLPGCAGNVAFLHNCRNPQCNLRGCFTCVRRC